jgi:hypothetical protein
MRSASAHSRRARSPGLEVRARLDGHSLRQAANWSGRIYAESGNTELAGWRAWVDYPVEVRRGEGALRLWATLAGGKVTQATAMSSCPTYRRGWPGFAGARRIGGARARVRARIGGRLRIRRAQPVAQRAEFQPMNAPASRPAGSPPRPTRPSRAAR